MRRGWLVLPLLVLVGLVSRCDAGDPYYDHGEPHGVPMTVAAAEANLRGPFVDALGETNLIIGVDCAPGDDGQKQEPNTHFRCELSFADGEPITRVVHVLENDQLSFED